jgi:cytoskeletal protein RodZ
MLHMAEGGMSVGAQLRASREARGLSIDAVAHTTRVQPRILAAIERDDLSAMPPRPFGRGFVRAYAAEMGLDGERTAQDYFAQFAPASPSPDAAGALPQHTGGASRAWPVAIVSLGVLAGVALAVMTGRPAATTGEGQDGTPIAEPSSATPQPGAGASPAAGTTSPSAPAPAPAAGQAANLTIVLTASRPCWVTATADGRRALYTTVVPGAPQTVVAAREIAIRVGDAGALSWTVNGGEPAVMGQAGQVREVRVTPETAATAR